jgi:hypothetical protein
VRKNACTGWPGSSVRAQPPRSPAGIRL